MITVIQGTTGSGKSSIMVEDMADFLLSGGVVAMNFTLSPGWLDVICAASHKYRSGRVDRELFRRSLWERCFHIGTQDTILELGKKIEQLSLRKGREGLGRLYLDEAQLLFNSRSWSKNQKFIEFFTQHRKLKWDVFLVTHTMDMIDKQIRGLVDLETRLRNLQKVKILGLIPLAWKPTFLAITRYAGIAAGAGEIYSRRIYGLNHFYKDLYDTYEVFAFDASSVSVSHQGEYTPAPPVRSLLSRIWSNFSEVLDKLFPVSSPAAIPACVWPQYHAVVNPSPGDPPGGATVEGLKRHSWTTW